jgi:hypothetical protein
MTTLVRMPFEGSNVPHVVLEVNQQCNISCKACYKDKFGMTKPVPELMEEIDFALSQRKLSTITLAGGEPVLHPKLGEIISYITNKGVTVQMLSNGLALTPEKLAELKRCGLKKIFLHIDRHQTRSDVPISCQSELELNPLREKIGKMIKDSGITASLQITLYKSSLSDLDPFMNFVLSSTWCSGLLVTCYTDFEKLAGGFKEAIVLGQTYKNPNYDVAKMDNIDIETFNAKKEVVDRLKTSLKMDPFAYVSSSDNDDELRWVLYYSFVITQDNGEEEVLHLGKDFGRLVNLSGQRRLKKEQALSFGRYLNKKTSIILLAAYALTSLNPVTAFRVAKFLMKLRKPGAQITHKSFTFQLSGPTVNEDGTIEYCKDCPDATVRNGVLVPVCMADVLMPPR